MGQIWSGVDLRDHTCMGLGQNERGWAHAQEPPPRLWYVSCSEDRSEEVSDGWDCSLQRWGVAGPAEGCPIWLDGASAGGHPASVPPLPSVSPRSNLSGHGRSSHLRRFLRLLAAGPGVMVQSSTQVAGHSREDFCPCNIAALAPSPFHSLAVVILSMMGPGLKTCTYS
mmetsp:Transcript_40339/g.72090  ORF Transcript_40339/g.72090 Transcript_40339/m.72090 type:complete len:169 (-) Transcript_40339:47-553(-)